ncbi:MAG: precorrin-4 C(11)-methyltransferase, partial [Chloroflexi bacterium]|nr:precorrin-4 C(11)-methyltransferase [Chloroflexota bacterium]
MALSPQVYFIGAGPGAPDLITLRGQQIIARADCVLYADSLVMPEIAQWAKPGAVVIPTAELNLDQIVAVMTEAVERGQVVARIHSGDPALYGAIHEQMTALDARNISHEIVPGVSAVFAAAAALGAELTAPGLTQTLICTRVSGRASPVPERESLRSLAAHGASLAIFLSITKARQVQDDLLTGYASETPVAILYRLTWPDEQIVRCRLEALAETVRAAGFTRHALIIVSPALSAPHTAASRLYSPEFKHRFRTQKAEGGRRKSEVGSQRLEVRGLHAKRTWNGPSAISHLPSAIISITRAGTELARRLAGPLQAVAYVPQRFAQEGEAAYSDSVIEAARR